MCKFLRIVSFSFFILVILILKPESVTASLSKPVIGPISYSSGSLVVGEPETLTFSLSDNANTGIARSYKVEMYGVRGDCAYFETSGNITIPAGYSSTTASLTTSFSSPGPLYTLIKVYPGTGGPLLAQRQSTYTSTVYGSWVIEINLPKSRLAKGLLTLYSADGNVQMSAQCLGLSQYRNSTTMYQTNGNTPTGVYQGRLDGPYAPVHSYGPYKVINMTAVSGAAKTSGRAGIWIHGGDPGISSIPAIYPLRMTNGCIRISNADQLKLQNAITALIADYHYSTGTIYINDY